LTQEAKAFTLISFGGIIQYFDANCCCGSENKLAGVKIHGNILTFKKIGILFLLMSLNGFILIRKWIDTDPDPQHCQK
jgi:hypothetical protein